MQEFHLGQLLIGLLAGMLTVFSPCVFPAIPMIATSSLGAHRFGPIALAAGLTISFTLIGVGVASLGIDLGIDGQFVRKAAASLILVAGLLMFSGRAQEWLSRRLNPLSTHADRLSRGLPTQGLVGQFALGCLLGAIWSPCSGPLLGAAIGMAATQETRLAGAVLMFVFGVGSSVPILMASCASRAWVMKRRGGILSFGSNAKKWVGAVLVAMAILILSGADHLFEAWVLNHLPQSWLEVITRF